MWRKLPLNVKLVVALIAVQASILAIGSIWLANWIEHERFEELEHRLDIQGDAVQGAISRGDNGLAFDGQNEAVRELAEEKGFYFLYAADSGEAVAESHGQSADIRQALRQSFRGKGLSSFYRVDVSGNAWIVQSERYLDGVAHVAAYAQPLLDELATFRRLMAIGVIAVLLATSFGSAVVVNASTRNIREFSRRLKKLKPPAFVGATDLVPQSAEEDLLFSSYAEMIETVRTSIENQRLFIAHASHELKTPIAAAFSALEVTLARPRLASDYEQTCRDVLAEINLLRRLSSHLLDLTRLETAAIEDEACDVHDVLSNVLARWKKNAAARGTDVQFSAVPTLGGWLVRGSSTQLEIAFSNLIDNAIKYGKPGGRLTVDLRRYDAQSFEVVIADDGRGMSPTDVARLGDVFFRADAARTGDGSFGLGFAYAKRIIERLGGSLAVESALEVGTTVTVRVVPAQRL